MFSCRQVFFFMVFSIREPAAAAAKVCAAAGGKGSQNAAAKVCAGAFPWCFPSGSQQQQQQKSDTSTIMGFRSYVRHFRGAILELLRPSEAWCFAAIREPAAAAAKVCAAAGGKGSQNAYIAAATAILLLLWVSEVTLGIFGMQFWGFSVLQRHGVFLPAGDFFHGVFHPGASSSSSKSTTIMGFRSYVRHFRGAILGLLRPSEAWCFPAGR